MVEPCVELLLAKWKEKKKLLLMIHIAVGGFETYVAMCMFLLGQSWDEVSSAVQENKLLAKGLAIEKVFSCKLLSTHVTLWFDIVWCNLKTKTIWSLQIMKLYFTCWHTCPNIE